MLSIHSNRRPKLKSPPYLYSKTESGSPPRIETMDGTDSDYDIGLVATYPMPNLVRYGNRRLENFEDTNSSEDT